MFNTKSNDVIYALVSSQASKPYNNTGKHLLDINWITTSSEATRPTLPKILLAVRWNHVWQHLRST